MDFFLENTEKNSDIISKEKGGRWALAFVSTKEGGTGVQESALLKSQSGYLDINKYLNRIILQTWDFHGPIWLFTLFLTNTMNFFLDPL